MKHTVIVTRMLKRYSLGYRSFSASWRLGEEPKACESLSYPSFELVFELSIIGTNGWILSVFSLRILKGPDSRFLVFKFEAASLNLELMESQKALYWRYKCPHLGFPTAHFLAP